MRLALFWAVIGKVRNYHYTLRSNVEERISIFFESELDFGKGKKLPLHPVPTTGE